MKKERQDAILSLIAREEIPTQELLRERVAAMGFEVTQATLSRDIRELHLVKQRRSGKRACYTAPVIQEGAGGIFQDAVLRTDYAGHTAVIHCRSGMAQAVAGLNPAPDYALIDGNRCPPGLSIPAEAVVKGDATSACIAAASILAKVSRDRYVTDVLDREYPQYRFAQHKGYGTALHYALLDQYGPCPERRLTFLKKWRQGREQP